MATSQRLMLRHHLLGRHVEKQARHARAQALGVDLTDVQKVVDELDLARGVGDGLGDLVDIVDDLDAVFAQDLGKAVVLLLGDL